MTLTKRLTLPIALIILVGLSAYSNSLFNPFIWDDEALIVGNYLIKDIRYLPQIFTKDLFFATTEISFFYRPLQSLSFMLDFHLFGLNPWGFHLTNILLHIFNAILIYFIFLELLKDEKIALLVALLFVAHPVHTEAVTYIAGRADPLVGLFILGSFFCFIHSTSWFDRLTAPLTIPNEVEGLSINFKQTPVSRQGKLIKSRIILEKTTILYISSLALFVLALLSKELAIVFPLALIIYYLSFRKEQTLKSGVLFGIIPFVVLGLIYILLRLKALVPLGHISFNAGYPVSVRLFVFITHLVTYFKILFLPFGLHMSRNVVLFSPQALLNPRVFFSIIFFILVVYAIILAYKKRNYFVGFWGSWFFVFLLPQSGLFPINAFMAEHFLYLPSIGFFAILGYFLLRYLTKRIWIIILIFLLLFYGYHTIQRNLEWRQPLRFYKSLVERSPYSFTGYNNLGLIYEQDRLLDKAQSCFEEAIRIKPDFWQAYLNRARIFYKKGKVNEAIILCQEIIKENPKFLYGYTVLASIYADEKLYNKAIEEFSKAARLFPGNPGIYNSLGLIYRNLSRDNSAIEYFKRAISLDSKNENFYNNLGVAYKDNGSYELAIESYLKALKINKNLAQAHNNLGIVYAILGRYPEAGIEFKKALELKPDYSDAFYNLGCLYWQIGELDNAKMCWQKTVSLEPEHKLAKEWLGKLRETR
ncbi:MAG: tetratricopeptide repeat protein [Candidatus Omnitrophota bacterium]